MSRSIATTVGIYNTEFSAVFHRDGSVTVREPVVQWVGGTGHLVHQKSTVSGVQAEAVKRYFAEGVTVMAATCFGGYLTLSDILNGGMSDGVKILGSDME